MGVGWVGEVGVEWALGRVEKIKNWNFQMG